MVEMLALGIGFVLIYLIIVIGFFVLIALFYKTLIDAMTLVRPTNRLTEVGNIALTFIPLFNLVYGFIVYPKICDSIKNEFNELGIQEKGDFGKSMAITFQILILTFIIPFLNFLTIIAALIIGIVFWVKINEYKAKLKEFNKDGFSNSPVAISNSTDILD